MARLAEIAKEAADRSRMEADRSKAEADRSALAATNAANYARDLREWRLTTLRNVSNQTSGDAGVR